MAKFALDRNFESIRSNVPGAKNSLELSRFGKDEYNLFVHLGDTVTELGTFTKSELRTIWEMLTARE